MGQVYDLVDATSCRFSFEVFLDITGAFDNVRWAPIFDRLEEMGASYRTMKIILSYLRTER